MQGFGAGPGAPGQTRDITKGGYPGSGGGSKGQVSPQAMPLGKTFTQRPATPAPTPLAPTSTSVQPPLSQGVGFQKM